ncbi:MAG TPA: DegT/DnrJ/EryC1/StrS family aminotransferase [Candidatus Dormibacteraeota bacterium]
MHSVSPNLVAPAARQRLYSRHRLDIEPSHIAFGLAALTAAGRDSVAAELEHAWSPDGRALAAHSVRAGFHLLLSALDLPAGTEVMFSAVTHPDMPRIAAHHGLVPVPVDLDRDTLAPRPDALWRAVTPRTRILVVAHLFGGLVDLDYAADLCDRHGLLLVEDCAQAYRGPDYTGSALADVSMFSFGLLKTATAAGGALIGVRQDSLLARMRALHEQWPAQERRSHLKRLAQTAAFLWLTRPLPYGKLARATGDRFDRTVNSAVRAFPASSTGELVRRLEQRPCAPLLRLLHERLSTFDIDRFDARAANGERLAAMLPADMLIGGRALDRTHWLFPISAPDPQRLVDAVRAAGFDASFKASSVSAVPAPPERPETDPERARAVMSRLVFLPAYPELPPGALERMAAAVASEVGHAHAAA